MEVAEARIDGVPISDPTEYWRIATEPGQTRPRIDITLKSGERTARVALLPFGVMARRLDALSYEEDVRRPIDLDAVGRGREQW